MKPDHDSIARNVVQSRTEIYYHALYQISDTLQNAHELCSSVDDMETVNHLIALQVERLAEKMLAGLPMEDV